jgi:hypothetical protein
MRAPLFRRRVMFGLSLPARSLRGRSASLRSVPDNAGDLLRKPLIWHALLVVRSAILSVEPIFLPALRERGQGGGRWAQQDWPRRLRARVRGWA